MSKERRGWVSHSGSLLSSIFSFHSFWTGNKWISCEQSTGSKKIYFENRLFFHCIFFAVRILLFYSFPKEPYSKGRKSRFQREKWLVETGLWKWRNEGEGERETEREEKRSKQEKDALQDTQSCVRRLMNRSSVSFEGNRQTVKKERRRKVEVGRKSERGWRGEKVVGYVSCQFLLQVINWCLCDFG